MFLIGMPRVFPESQLDVEASVSEGARTLRAFLLYARNGGRRPDAMASDKAQPTARLTMMRHIQGKLAEHGWEADLDLGQSMARVDIAIRSKVDRQRYAMGVLLDGPGTAWAQTAIGREVGRIEYLRRYQWHVRPMPMRAWATAPEETLAALVSELEAADAGGVKAADAPAVALPAVERFANLAPDAAPRVASRARFPSAPAAAKVAMLLPLQEVATTGLENVPTAPAPVAQRVQPGSTVRYRHLDSDEAREITLTGPTVARGVRALNLDAPLADALMDATVGDVVQMSLNGDVRELEVLEVLAPPLGI